MRMQWSERDKAFRDEVRAFCATHLPDDLRAKVLAGLPTEKSDHARWQKMLHDRGWIAGHWPKQYGGQDWTAAQSFIFQEETTRAGAPWLLPFGVNFVGPVIYTFGNQAQKDRHLPGILSSDTFWCQGYSEPGAGSDLARLRTRAVRDGDHYVVNGQKIWTTLAHWADWIFALVRTDPDAKPQAGISFLLIDMKTPGVEVRPIISIDGQHGFNEVFFTDVRVPVENLIGEENKGWTYAKFLLGHERVLSAEVGRSARLLARAKRTAARTPSAHGTLARDPRWRDRCAALEMRLATLEWTSLRMLDRVISDDADPVGASVLKIRGSDLLRDIAEFAVESLGPEAVTAHPDAPVPVPSGNEDLRYPGGLGIDFLHLRAATIYGGSHEVQRGIIARHALGM